MLDYNTARVFHFAGSAKNTQIYSKTICIEPKRHLPLVRCTEWGAGNAQGTRFFNIIFYVDGRVTCDWDKSSVTVFENHIFGDGTLNRHWIHMPSPTPHSVSAQLGRHDSQI